MKKVLLGIALGASLSLSGAASAHNFGEQQCDVNVNGEIEFNQGKMLITTDSQSVITLTKAGEAWVDGQALQLSSQEASYVTTYYQEVEDVIPEAMQLAADSIRIARVALDKVFTGILGEGSDFVESLNDTLNSISNELESRVYPETGVVMFGESLFSDGGNFKNSLDSKIDTAVEELMEQGMGELLMALGRSMLSGDSDFSSFEQRMEQLGSNFEQEIEAQAAEIETAANELCKSLEDVDAAESQLQQIQSLRDVDLVKVKNYI